MSQAAQQRLLALRIGAAGLLAATAAIHLDLYLTGYRSIPTIGWLFLLQVIAGFGLAAVTLRRASPLVTAAGAGFAISTLGGYLLSLWVGLFGFTELRTTAGIVAGVIEIAAFAALAILTVSLPSSGLALAGANAGGLRDRLAALQARRPAAQMAGRAIAGATVLALAVLGISVTAAGGTPGAVAGNTPPGSGPVLVIVIKNFQFSPKAPQVSAGQRIEVKNEDSVTHTLSAGPAASIAGKFNTGSIGPGQAHFFTAPQQVGAVPFYCMLHPFMTGMLIVGHSRTNAAALSSFLARAARAPRSYCGGRPGRLVPATRGPVAR